LRDILDKRTSLLAFDIASRGRPQCATVLGGLFLVSSQVVRITISGTDTWIAFARWLGA
jgi:hypothetical protein